MAERWKTMREFAGAQSLALALLPLGGSAAASPGLGPLDGHPTNWPRPVAEGRSLEHSSFPEGPKPAPLAIPPVVERWYESNLEVDPSQSVKQRAERGAALGAVVGSGVFCTGLGLTMAALELRSGEVSLSTIAPAATSALTVGLLGVLPGLYLGAPIGAAYGVERHAAEPSLGRAAINVFAGWIVGAAPAVGSVMLTEQLGEAFPSLATSGSGTMFSVPSPVEAFGIASVSLTFAAAPVIGPLTTLGLYSLNGED